MNGPYMNEDGDWWVAVEDVVSFRQARDEVLICLSYDVPSEGTLHYRGKVRTSVCDAPYGEHSSPGGGVDPANCEDTCRKNILAYHFEEHRFW